jgi:hypothetical protein
MSGTHPHRLLSSIFVGAMLASTPGRAAFRDGNGLLVQCTATIGAEMNFCYGYIDAVADQLLEGNALAGIYACITTELDDSRSRDIVVRFLRQNPGLRRASAAELIARALSDAFPCR